MPGSPETRTKARVPFCIARRHVCNRCHSARRPTSGGPCTISLADRRGQSRRVVRRAATRTARVVSCLGATPELALEDGHARVVGAQRTSALPEFDVEAHQAPIRGLVERIDLDELLCPSDGRGCVALRLRRCRRVLEQPYLGLAQPLALGLDPILVAPGEQVTGVQRDRPFQRSTRLAPICLGGGLVEVEHIDACRCVETPSHGCPVDLQERVRLRRARRRLKRAWRRLVCAWRSDESGQNRKAICWRRTARADAGSARPAATAADPRRTRRAI